MIDNSIGIPISHIGHNSFHALGLVYRSLTMNNMLFVPNIAKNLLSVSQFVHDNSIFFEFHSNYFCVKENIT